jgi:hypothetical protein
MEDKMGYKIPSQKELNAKCEEAIKRYLAMDPNEAKVDLMVQIQGWIGSRAAHGHPIGVSLSGIVDMCSQIMISQLDKDPSRESQTLKDLYSKRKANNENK